MNKPVYVARPSLPPLDEFVSSLEQIWASRVLTNGGPFHQKLERDLATYLGVPFVSLFSNGTLALVTALQTLRITGEVITTPYSFVATAHSLLWNGIKPVFVDVDPVTLNLDPAAVEAAITPQTTAILPVHCYGQPCDTAAIQGIADRYGLKVIYDAAHAFGVQHEGASVLSYGDISTLSFHATKVFHTFEGGAVICQDSKTKQRIDHLKNFGFVDEVTVVAPGINAKMSEVNAAFGLIQLQHIQDSLAARKQVAERYTELLSNIPGVNLVLEPGKQTQNYSYFPIRVTPQHNATRDQVYAELKSRNIYARRYFYPLISDFPMYRGLPSAAPSNLPNARKAADQIICLPMFEGLEPTVQEIIASVLRG